ncbi:hypothetical protein LMC02_09995 [Limosilactobacillus reuteri]|uniref:hypothetical protein n=1 Tax=Limosilactobacillus reuteri TaxID=1598 RepID=UPI001E53AB36|nr:hypothetical protein [Limosilactobacillus reuteri]MCC4500319.1 hypothetical protein [Limosilactobacillus reuteri]MCC4500644.1 hypothetical protein [Limosilactobacillus reuteri]
MDLGILFQNGNGRIYFQDGDQIEVIAASLKELMELEVISSPEKPANYFQTSLEQAADLIDVQKILADYDMYYATEVEGRL